MSSIGHGMFSYIPDSSMIGTVFCNFIANAMYAHTIHVFLAFHSTPCAGASRIPSSTCNLSCKAQPGTTVTSPARRSPTTATTRRNHTPSHFPSQAYRCTQALRLHLSHVPPFLTRHLQYGQPKRFLFSKLPSGSFSIRAIAIVHGKSAVCFSCTDPEPEYPLLTEQRALVSYMHAVCKCHTQTHRHTHTHTRRCSLPLSARTRRLCRNPSAISHFTHPRVTLVMFHSHSLQLLCKSKTLRI